MRRLRNAVILFFVSTLTLLFVTPGLRAAENTIWQIGTFDQSSHEFNNAAPVGNADYNPVFTIGKSATNDWPGRQPGSENPAEGLRPHPFTVLFDLPTKPVGTYSLAISALLSNIRYPHLEISINGRKGTFYFPRKLNYYPGDSGFPSPIYSGGEITVGLPSAALRLGENKLVLTALDDARDGPGDSWLTYDALRLTHSSETARGFSPQMALEPTIYYVGKVGNLEETTQVTVNLDRKVRRGTVRLTVSGKHFEASLSPVPDFGEQRFEFLVPELSGPAPAEITLHANGKTTSRKFTFQPERKWKLFVVPHEHLDIGYTDYRGKVAELHSRNQDTMLRLLAEDPDMRWTIDGTWIVQHYLATRKPSAQKAFLDLVRKGRIGVPAQYANLMTGTASLEEMIRSTFYGYHLHEKMGLHLNMST